MLILPAILHGVFFDKKFNVMQNNFGAEINMQM